MRKRALGYFFFEFLTEIRNKEVITWTFLFPLILFFILSITIGGSIGENKEISFKYALLADKNSTVKVIFQNIPILKKKDSKDLKDALGLLKKGKVDAVVSEKKGNFIFQENIDIYYAKERPSSSMAKDVIEGILNEINLRVSLIFQYVKYYMIKNFALGTMKTDISPLIEDMKPLQYEMVGLSTDENKKFSYNDYLFPGMLFMFLIVIGSFNIPLKITFYRESGILKRLFVTPIDSKILFTGIFFSSLSIVIIQYIIFALFSKYVMKVTVNVFSKEIILYSFIIYLFSYTLGFVIATIAKNSQFANILGNAIFFPLQFLGGLYFPIDNAPWVLKWFVLINPLTYIASQVRDAMGILASPYPHYLSYLVPSIWIIIGVLIIINKFSWMGSEA